MPLSKMFTHCYTGIASSGKSKNQNINLTSFFLTESSVYHLLLFTFFLIEIMKVEFLMQKGYHYATQVSSDEV